MMSQNILPDLMAHMDNDSRLVEINTRILGTGPLSCPMTKALLQPTPLTD